LISDLNFITFDLMFSKNVYLLIVGFAFSCSEPVVPSQESSKATEVYADTSFIPNDAFGESVRLGRNLMLHTASLIGPNGSMGQYLGNRMNCTNCHQEAGTKPFAFNLMRAHQRYPQYRARENKILSLADRVNNCIERPHLGKPLPYDSKEMLAFLSYFKWLNGFVFKLDSFAGEQNLVLDYPDEPASSERGEALYTAKCSSCHGINGEGVLDASKVFYTYPPLWGKEAYEAGSSMHRVSKMATWIKANMPHQIAKYNAPVLTDQEALDLAAFINNDEIHVRKKPQRADYPNPKTKPFDYDRGPFADTFSQFQHKYGPFKPIIAYKQSNP
jgi:thiosulfate dehydrogenase